MTNEDKQYTKPYWQQEINEFLESKEIDIETYGQILEALFLGLHQNNKHLKEVETFLNKNNITVQDALELYHEESHHHGDEEVLFNADKNCKHDIIALPSGGVKCTKCKGWFCF